MDLLFAAKSPWVWAAEANFTAIMAENPDLGATRQRDSVTQAEKGLNLETKTEHRETVFL
jgi:hypothetical protein